MVILALATGSPKISINVPFVITSSKYGVTSTISILLFVPRPVSIDRFVLFGPTTTLNVVVTGSALNNTLFFIDALTVTSIACLNSVS